MLPVTPPLAAAPRGAWLAPGLLRRWLRRCVVALIVIGLIAALFAARWIIRLVRVDWSIRQGVSLLADAHTPRDVQTALAQWEASSASIWRGREDDWTRHVFWRFDPATPAIRLLLTHVTGVDYGDRERDWKRWQDTQKRLARGEQPAVPAREQVHLTPRWKAPIGLTSWYSSILPIGGTIFVPSLGGGFDGGADEADGVIAVRGTDGDAHLIFRALDRPPADMLGLAAGDQVLFAACRGGMVYCLTREGALQWKSPVGARVVSIPLVFDANRTGADDVAVVSATGRVVAFDGDTGKTLWTTPIDNDGRLRSAEAGLPFAEQSAVLASLALVDPPRSASRAVVATTGEGLIALLSASGGNMLWRQTLESGFVAPPLGVLSPGGGDAAVLAADVAGRVWTLVPGPKTFQPLTAWNLPGAEDGGVVAALRSTGREGPAKILACTTGVLRGGKVSLLDSTGTIWRYAVEGEIRAAPAVADLNGDGESEFVVVSSVFDEGGSRGWLTVLSLEGHCLRRIALEAPSETPPVVADVDGNEILDVLIADKAGWLHCYSVGKFGRVEWGLAGGDARNSRHSGDAYSFSQTPSAYQWDWKPGKVHRSRD